MKSYAHPLKTAEKSLMSFTGVMVMHPTDWLRFPKAPQSNQNRLLREGAARPQAETVNGNGF